MRDTHLDAEGSLVSALSLHLILDGSEVGAGHVEISAADVAGVLEVRRSPDHAPVYPQPLLWPALSFAARPRALLRQATREPLHPNVPGARRRRHLLFRPLRLLLELRRPCGGAG